jgi:hypothetical protein
MPPITPPTMAPVGGLVFPEANADEDGGVYPVLPGVGADVDDGVDATSPCQQNSWLELGAAETYH